MITLSTYHLSADGVSASADENAPKRDVTPETALAALRAFAAMPALQLVGIDAKLYLSSPEEKIAVQNTRGKLLVAVMPELFNTWQECTPEAALARLVGADAPLAGAQLPGQAAKPWSPGQRRPVRLRRLLGSGWVLGSLAVIALAVAWLSFSPDTPDGVTLIRDSAKISQLHVQFNGRYGAEEQPGQMMLELGNGKYRSLQAGPAGAAASVLIEADYQFGLRDGHVVLVLANGAILEPQPDGGLKFLNSVYPRLTAPR